MLLNSNDILTGVSNDSSEMYDEMIEQSLEDVLLVTMRHHNTMTE